MNAKRLFRRFSSLLLALLLALPLFGCDALLLPADEPAGPADQKSPAAPEQPEAPPTENTVEEAPPESQPSESEETSLAEDGWYSSKEDVALYLHLYGRLPDNFVSKADAQAAGWTGGNVERYTGEGTAIGGSRFGNYEELLPKAEGRTYQECDIDTVGASSRGAKRIVFSNDGLIYYTDDHYESFELLYGEP